MSEQPTGPPAYEPLPELLRRAASERSGDTYLSYDGEAITFRELADAVADTQRTLVGHGVSPGDRVAVMLPNQLEHMILVHALVGMRAVWVPVNTRLRGAPLEHLLGIHVRAVRGVQPSGGRHCPEA